MASAFEALDAPNRIGTRPRFQSQPSQGGWQSPRRHVPLFGCHVEVNGSTQGFVADSRDGYAIYGHDGHDEPAALILVSNN